MLLKFALMGDGHTSLNSNYELNFMSTVIIMTIKNESGRWRQETLSVCANISDSPRWWTVRIFMSVTEYFF